MKKFLVAFLLCFVVGAAHAVCADGEFDADGTCVESKFKVTTTNLNLSVNTEFKFYIAAKGTFYVDCGENGTLSGDYVSGNNTINKPGATAATYTCTYNTTGGVKTIKFGGRATLYNTNATTSTIRFSNTTNVSLTPTLVGGISGSLGAIFPSLGNNNAEQPRFYETFKGCTNMTGSIPSGLFTGISGQPVSNMFNGTFSGCSGLTGSIPALFSGLDGTPQASMFHTTFNGCRELTGSIPAGLFGNISGAPASAMFSYAFSGCTNLTGYIPSDIFKNITSPGSNGISVMFNNTNLYTTCPCGTRPAATGWGDTTVNGKAICEIGLKSGEHWNNGICTTDCAPGFSRLKTSTGLSYPILSAKTTVPSIHVQAPNDTVCYVPLVSGATNGELKVLFNETTYHASVPDETAPVGFTGQPQ